MLLLISERIFFLPEQPTITPGVVRPTERPLPNTDQSYDVNQPTSDVVRGRTLYLDVVTSGRPGESVTWRLPSGRRLRTGETFGRFTVFSNGTLRIVDAQPQDSGSYEVILSSPGGEATQASDVKIFGKNVSQRICFFFIFIF